MKIIFDIPFESLKVPEVLHALEVLENLQEKNNNQRVNFKNIEEENLEKELAYVYENIGLTFTRYRQPKQEKEDGITREESMRREIDHIRKMGVRRTFDGKEDKIDVKKIIVPTPNENIDAF